MEAAALAAAGTETAATAAWTVAMVVGQEMEGGLLVAMWAAEEEAVQGEVAELSVVAETAEAAMAMAEVATMVVGLEEASVG